MLRRPKPKTLTAEETQQIILASAQQTGSMTAPKSYDSNYPVFEVPVNQKLLVYIPNHTVEGVDGVRSLRMDKFAAHPVIDGRSYADIRCTQGVVIPSLHLDGSCPLCEGISKCWDLFNKDFDSITTSRNLDKTSSDDTVKNLKKELLNKRVIREAQVWYTFPIVVIACEEKDGKLTVNPKLTPDGKLQGTPMWYSIREQTFKDKWEGGYDSIIDDGDDGEITPAGRWAILNFTYQPKSGKPDKMGSAKNLKVTFKPMDAAKYGSWEKYFDELTAEWTPQKAQEVVVKDVLRDMEETQEVADSVLKPVNEKLAMYTLAEQGTTAPQVTSSDAAGTLESFGVANPVNAPANTGVAEALPVGEMPVGMPPIAGV